MKTKTRYIPAKGDVFNVKEKFDPLRIDNKGKPVVTGATGLCAPYKCTKRHSIGKSLISIEARGWSREPGGTPWSFRVSEWDFERDGQ